MERDRISGNEIIQAEPQPGELPRELLDSGDLLTWRIETYLHEAQWWTLSLGGELRAAVGCLRIGAEEAEIANAAGAVHGEEEAQRFVRLLNAVCGELRQGGVRRVMAYVGSWQTDRLTAYQQAGFRVAAVESDYYACCWAEGASTNGIRRLDRLMLEKLPESEAGSSARGSGVVHAAPPIVRRVELRDSQGLLAMKKQLDRETTSMLYEPGERRMTDGDQLEQIRGLLRSSNSLMLVAESDGCIVGYLEATGGKVRRNQHTIYIVIGILEAHTGYGLGRQLFAEMLEWTARRHIVRAELTVQASNQRAYRLYRSIGFKLEGIMRGALIIEGEPVDLYQMGLDLRTIQRCRVDK
ncbi:MULTISPECIES: GNAT family N-acetyltransferase [Saccharibacillus]|uniref:GNAT family N-acetyltransferase n=1 Tax=Saccharibacillus TaxID=456492 RepID=UPI0012398504|nr:GNAT family N-acetyltransferase [Saccharibacillus sp. WB 17]MWJ29722.1 GNAT family N-acetyltransferase [Saccharibacillus sp. WB 17]